MAPTERPSLGDFVRPGSSPDHQPPKKEATAPASKPDDDEAALAALDKGQADFAVVKNRVWDKEKSKYAGLAEVGKDLGENPDNTLMVSAKADQAIAAKVRDALLAIEADTSAEAKAVKDSLKLAKFIPTGADAFTHSLAG